MILDQLKKMFDESCKHYTEEINLTGLDLAGYEMKNCLISLIKQTLQLMINGNKNAVITRELETTIDKAYRKLSLKVHPDKKSEDLKERANKAFDALNKFKQESFGTKEFVSVLVQLKPIPWTSQLMVD